MFPVPVPGRFRALGAAIFGGQGGGFFGGRGGLCWTFFCIGHTRQIAENAKKTTMKILKPYRARIDALDDKIVDLLAERVEIVREVARLKAERDIPAVLEDRVNEVIDRTGKRASAQGLDGELVRRLYTLLVAYCCDLEAKHIEKSRHDIKRTG